MAEERIVKETRQINAGMMGKRQQYRVYQHTPDMGELPTNSELVSADTPLTNEWVSIMPDGVQSVGLTTRR